MWWLESIHDICFTSDELLQWLTGLSFHYKWGSSCQRRLRLRKTEPSRSCGPHEQLSIWWIFAPSCWRRFTHCLLNLMTVASSSSLVVQNMISFLLKPIASTHSNLNTIRIRKSVAVSLSTRLFVAIVKTPSASSKSAALPSNPAESWGAYTWHTETLAWVNA